MRQSETVVMFNYLSITSRSVCLYIRFQCICISYLSFPIHTPYGR